MLSVVLGRRNYNAVFLSGLSILGSMVNQRGGFQLVSGPTFLSNVRCSGDEDTLLDCQHELLGELCSSSHLFDATVHCEGRHNSILEYN